MASQTKTTRPDLASLPPSALLRLPQVLALIPVSRSSWYAGIAEGYYPPPVRIGKRVSAWRYEDIVALIKEGCDAR